MNKQKYCPCGGLRTRWKQVCVHSLILGAFVFYCFFLAAPLWNRLESVPNESSLYEISLPAASSNILCNIERVVVNTQTIDLQGWAFIKGHDSAGSQTYVVLMSADHTYVFDSLPAYRTGVTAAFKDQHLDLDWSGFWAWIPLRKIGKGQYQIGILIKKGDIKELQYTTKFITR